MSEETLVRQAHSAPEEHPDVARQIAHEGAHPIIVADRLDRPHPLVIRTKAHLPRRPDHDGTLWSRLGPLPVRVSRDQLARALRIFDSFLKACEQRGFAVSVPDERDVKIRVHGEDLAVGLEEPSRRTDHILTAREERELWQGRGWSIPRYDYAPTGVLTFTIHEYTDGIRHRWSDGKSRTVEACLNEIIVALVRIAVTVLRPRRLEHERQRTLRLEAERRRQHEQNRLSALNQNLEAWRRNQDLRGFLAVVEKTAAKRWGKIPENSGVELWLRWARDLADRTDPLEGFVANLREGEESRDVE